MFAFYNRHSNTFYNNLIKLSRNIFFYKELKLQDNFDTRAILILLHLSIVIIAVKDSKNQKFPQKIFDNIFLNIEYHLREMGDGDVAVNKKMKNLTRIFYDILLTIDKSDSIFTDDNFRLLKKYFFNHKNQTIINFNKLSDYFSKFKDFCFDLDVKNMLNGSFNFIYK